MSLNKPCPNQLGKRYTPDEKIAQVQVTEILNYQKNHDRSFHPSRSELREWYLVASQEQKMGIEAIGRQLNDAYCEQMGIQKAEVGERATVLPPLDYRSDRVSITKSEFENMRRSMLTRFQTPELTR